MRPGLRLAAPLTLLALLPACASDPTQGYALTSAYAADVRSVSVPVFANTSFSHGLEARLTEAIIKEIHASTPWVVLPAARADTVLSGSVRNTRLRPLSTNSTSGLVQEMAFDVAVDFQWRDARSGMVLVSRQNFHGVGAFVPARGAAERIEIGETGAVEVLAKDIVRELRADW